GDVEVAGAVDRHGRRLVEACGGAGSIDGTATADVAGKQLQAENPTLARRVTAPTRSCDQDGDTRTQPCASHLLPPRRPCRAGWVRYPSCPGAVNLAAVGRHARWRRSWRHAPGYSRTGTTTPPTRSRQQGEQVLAGDRGGTAGLGERGMAR